MTETDILRFHIGKRLPFGRFVIAWLHAAAERRRQRRALAMLDEHLLRDIGVTREQARAEARRAPWR